MKRKCSTLSFVFVVLEQAIHFVVTMETNKRQVYVIPETEMIQLVENNSILNLSDGTTEGFSEGEI